jgi:uncharacterized membrane protein YgcG
MGDENRPAPQDQVRQLYEDAEKRTAAAMEELVSREAFGELLARATENVMAVTKIGFDAMDTVVRNLRLAGRRDVARLGSQIARTEDKLELVLQEVERLRDELGTGQGRSRSAPSSSGRSSAARQPSARSSGGKGKGSSGGGGSQRSNGSRSRAKDSRSKDSGSKSSK